MPAVTTVRARVRAEMTERDQGDRRARHLATDGAANLSLRAVARDLGMASSAVYRYFPSRDELLTALIIDAYDALGDAVEAGRGAPSTATDLPAGCTRPAARFAAGRWRTRTSTR